MSKRGQVELASDERVDSPCPVRRSSRISSGLNVTSSPALKPIKTRRSSANSLAEKNIVEENTSPKDKRKTRRASTDEEPKPSSIRSRRSSVSKVIEEEKASIPNSPGRRSSRISSPSPSLDVPARRTRKSSQDAEILELPARRTTRRSSTGIQDSTVEEIIEKAKPVTRRRRSSSIDEQEENIKIENIRPKTKRLFNEDNQLEPIVEQDQEVKDKGVFVEKQGIQESSQTVELIQGTSINETEKIIEDLKEVLAEESISRKSISGSSAVFVQDEGEAASEKNELLGEKIGPKKNDLPAENSLDDLPHESLEEVDSKLSNGEKSQPSVAKLPSENTLNIKTDIKSPLLEKSAQKKYTLQTSTAQKSNELKIMDEVSDTLNSRDQIQLERTINEKEGFSSPGSDKENTSVNILGKSLSAKVDEGNLNGISQRNVFAGEINPRNSVCEPMDVDEDEEDVFAAHAPSKNDTLKRLSMNEKQSEEPKQTDDEGSSSDKVSPSKTITNEKPSGENGPIEGNKATSEILTVRRLSLKISSDEEQKITIGSPQKSPKRSSLNSKSNDTKKETVSPKIQTPETTGMIEKSTGNNQSKPEVPALENEVQKKSHTNEKPWEQNGLAGEETTVSSEIQTSGRSSESMNRKYNDEEKHEDTGLFKVHTPKRSSLNKNEKSNEETRDEVTNVCSMPTSNKSSVNGTEMDTADETISLCKISSPRRSNITENHKEVERAEEIIGQDVSRNDFKFSNGDVSVDGTINDDKCTTEGSFLQLNSSPEKELLFPHDHSSISSTKESKNDEDCASDTSIRLVDSDDEGETLKETTSEEKQNNSAHIEENHSETCLISTENISLSESDEVIFDKSFDSDEHTSYNSKICIVDSDDEKKKDSNILVDSGDEIDVEVVDSNDETTRGIVLVEKDSKEAKNNTEQEQPPSRRSLIDKINKSDTEIDIPIIEKDNQITNIEENTESKDHLSEMMELQQCKSPTSSQGTKSQNKDISEVVSSPKKTEEKDSHKSLEKDKELKNHQSNDTIECIVDSDSSSEINEKTLEKSMMENNDSKLGLFLVKSEIESFGSETDSSTPFREKKINITQESVKTEDEEINESMDTEASGNVDGINNQHSKATPKCEKEIPSPKSVDRKTKESSGKDELKNNHVANISTTSESPCRKILLQSIEVIKHNNEEVSSTDLSVLSNSHRQEEKYDERSRENDQTLKIKESKPRKTRSRFSMPNDLNKNDEDSEFVEIKVEKTNSRYSLPSCENKNLVNNVSIPNSTKSISKYSTTEKAYEAKFKNEKNTSCLATSKNSSDRKETYSMTSPNDENNCDQMNFKNDELNSKTKYKKECASSKKKSEDVIKRPSVCSEEASDEEKDGPKTKTAGNTSEKSKRKLLEIMNRSGIEVEDHEILESSGDDETNEYLDNMADEDDDRMSNEDSDGNEIKDEGESVLSSCSDEKSSTDEYDLDDPFINDEESELSGGEEVLGSIGTNGSKKYKRIIQPSNSDSDEEIEKESSNTSRITTAKSIPVEEKENTQEVIETFEEEKSFEEKLDSILKLDPVQISTPNKSINDVMNSSKISESSVILQETCSVGAAKSKVILNRINGMVDVFCKNINESEGNISLNVSLNYIPPPTSIAKSSDTTNSIDISLQEKTPKSMDLDQLHMNLSRKSSRLSNNEEKKEVLVLPKNTPEKTDGQGADDNLSGQIDEYETLQNDHSPKVGKDESESKNETKMTEKTKTSKKRKLEKLPPLEKTEITAVKSRGKERKKKTFKPPSDIHQDEKIIVEKEKSESNVPPKKKKKNNEVSEAQVLFKKERDSEKSVQKVLDNGKGKKVSDSKDTSKNPKVILEPKTKKNKMKYDKTDEKQVDSKISYSLELQNRNTNTQDKLIKTVKLGKRKHSESSELVSTIKKLRSKTTGNDKNQSEPKSTYLKEIKPTKSSKSSDFENDSAKNKVFKYKTSKSNKQSEWEEEKILVRPSAATTSKSGFNLEKLIGGDFKNRMIYDSTRNKREYPLNSRKYQK